ncbi:MAG: YkgJ family cysteine cluster protein [Spirochaetes bacterium]|nr:YkgJ family cysteine cluster protein [Spirochaetota bacterium]
MQSLRYYQELIQKIDAFTASVVSTYSTMLHCREGCSSCCILESIMPVEVVPILKWYVVQPVSVQNSIMQNNSNSCIFLLHDSCLIYPHRPIICRTHGYPVAINNTVDICPLNSGIIFEPQYILNLENCNTMLAAINILFIKEIAIPALQKERINLRTFFQSPETDIPSIVHALKGY